MSIKRPQLINEEIYHIVIRGVGNTRIFKSVTDYYRGIFSLYEFNNANPVEITKRRREIRLFKNKFRKKIKGGLSSSKFGGGQTSLNLPDNRESLVEILAFCFMPNHIHLLVRQIKNNGITQFMRKLGTGYAYYFNIKYDRKGHLFQSRFMAVHIKTNEQLKNVFVYIHANPISLIEPNWKEKGIKNPNKVIEFLENKYRWSSYFDYICKKNFPSVTEREFMLKVMGGEQDCRKFVENWVRYKGEIRDLESVVLE